MFDLKKLRENRNAALKAAEDYVSSVQSTCETEKREWTDQEVAKSEELTKAAEAIEAQVVKAESANSLVGRLGAIRAGLAQPEPPRLIPVLQPTPPAMADPLNPVRTMPAVPIRHNSKSFGDDYTAMKFAHWLVAMYHGRQDSIDFCRNHGVELGAVMSGINNTTGGVLVPDVFHPDLISLVEGRGVFRNVARRIPMTTDHEEWPRRTSGQTAYFVGENTAATESDVGTDLVALTAKKVQCMTQVPIELMQDARIGVADFVARESAHAIATKEDQCGFVGTGAQTYGGIHGVQVKIDDGNHTASIHTALAGNTYFGVLDLVDIEALIGKLPEFPGIQPAFYISKAGAWASLHRLADAAGGVTREEMAGVMRPVFLGYPVIYCQEMFKTLTASINQIHMLFGDMAMAAMFGERMGFTFEMDSSRYFEKSMIAIKATVRFDINVHDLGDTSNAGPIVALKTPAA